MRKDFAMTDPRVTALADVLVSYSADLRPGQTVALVGPVPATPLLLALYERALAAGAHPYILAEFPEATELLLRHGDDAQLAHVSPLQEAMVDGFDSIMRIMAPANTRTLSGADPVKQRAALAGQREVRGRMIARMTDGRHRDLITLFPTPALAQEADMSLSDYEDFVFRACRLHTPDPVAAWREQSATQQRLVDWLRGKERMQISGPGIDLELGIAGRGFINADGKVNFPDGEIFTSPEEDATRGHVTISYPAVFNSREVNEVELWFEAGRLVKYTATKGADFLEQMVQTDDGARRLGEIAIGTNPDIRRFTKNTLLDEKIAGTIHMALGQSFAGIGGRNQSALHWDMVTDMTGGEIRVDGTVIYRDGAFVI
jgi:aminopeptidase